MGGFHRAGRGGHGRSLQNHRAGRRGRQQNRLGRGRFQAGRRGRQEEVAAGYDAPADDAYGAPAEEYGAPADGAYGAPAEEYGAPADDAYGAPAEGSADYDDYASGDVPLDAYAATEAAPTYEDARRGRARGGFGRSAARSNGRKAVRGGRARSFGKANRRPSAVRKAPRAGRNQRPAPRRQQEQRRGRGLIPIPIPHRGPRRNAIAFRHQG